MTTQEKVIKPKLGLLELGKQLGNVTRACRVMGYSRDSYYRFKALYDEYGEEGLRDLNRSKPNVKNRVSEEIEEKVVEMAFHQPAYGQVRVSNELKKDGIFVSPGGVRGVWLRHDLETFKKRLKALETRMSQENLILTESQVAALEKKKEQEVAHGEIESEHPGYLGSQDTFYVGTLKGVGRIYQQTFVDTYSKVAICKLYTTKTALTSADLLNDGVLPFFESHGIPLLRILTDRGTEYCGKLENHEYQLYLSLEDIDHSRTKVRSPQTNGICERFHRTVLNEFYQVAFRKKIYRSLEELQRDLDVWLEHYNTQRSHSGKWCYGKTPMQTFLDSIHIAKEKMIGHGPVVEVQEVSQYLTDN
jgi:transposase InsO family protein